MLTIVISAFNEEKKIGDCLESIKKIADEIIFIDNTSSDKTVSIAKTYTDKIFIKPNNKMLNVNKNFGFTKAANEWILSLDADERLTPELAKEIEDVLSKPTEVCGYFISRKNIIFGKWIEHTGWYPDKQLRLFKAKNGRFEEKHIHELLTVKGQVESLKNPMIHLNYESISQFLSKMIILYTPSEAENIINQGYVFDWKDSLRMPSREFLQRYFSQKGYKDGLHGLVLSLLMAFYHFVIFLKLWEHNKFIEKKDIWEEALEEANKLNGELKYWVITASINESKLSFQKLLLKLKRKNLKIK